MVPNDGSWIAPPGRYQDLAKNLCGSDPRLCQQDKKTLSSGIDWSARPARVILLESGHGSDPRAPPLVFNDAEKLRKHIQDRTVNSGTRARNATYIVENLNQDLVGVLGPSLNAHPSMFMEYERVSRSSTALDRGQGTLLASSLATRAYLRMSYDELVPLPKEVRGIHRLRCADTGRNIHVTRINGEIGSTGMVHRKCIFWSRKRQTNDGWDSMVICDPPLQRVRATEEGREFPLAPRPLEDGYIDFLPEDIQARCLRGPPRTSLADDLCFYLTTHGTLVGTSDSDSASVFLKKIVASHYSKQVDYLRSNMRRALQTTRRHSDFDGSELTAVVANWSDVQTLTRRLDDYRHELEEILVQLRISLDPPLPSEVRSWQDTAADFRFLYHRFESIRQYADNVNASITGLTSIAGNRQAFREQRSSLRAAERSRHLTFIGLIFIPLALISSLFSMSEPYGPGGDRFWLYFAISVPATAIVVASYYVFDLADSAHEAGRSILFLSGIVRALHIACLGRRRPDRSSFA